MNDRQLETALAYLNEQSGRYSLEALRGQLLQSGYDPATVDWAIQVHQGNTPGPPKARAGRKILLVVGVDVLLAAAALGLAALGTTGQAPGILGFILFVLVSLEFLGGLILCLFKEAHSWGLGLLMGSLLFVGVAILAFGGFCLYAITHEGAH